MNNTVVFNKAFKECNESRARYKVVMGGAGSGKSTNVAMDYILKLSDPAYTGSNLLVVRSCEQSHGQSTFVELSRAIEQFGLQKMWDIKPSILLMRNKNTGSVIYFRGCNDQKAIERLKSIQVKKGKLCWVWIEEATELRQNDLEIIDDRLRGVLPANLYYQITMTFNPVSATHWIKKVYWDSSDPNIFKCHTTYKDNKFIDPQYAIRMERRKETDPQGYKVYALGEWGVTEGLILRNYEVGSYDPAAFDRICLGTDFGFNHLHATLMLAYKDDNVYILRECVCKEMTKGEILKKLAQKKMPKNKPMYCDSAEPASIKEFRNSGYMAMPVSKEQNSVHGQINWLKQRKIFIDGSCVNTLKEIQQYRYVQDKVTGEYTDEPITVGDDCMAALRYGIEQWRKNKTIQTLSKGVLSL